MLKESQTLHSSHLQSVYLCGVKQWSKLLILIAFPLGGFAQDSHSASDSLLLQWFTEKGIAMDSAKSILLYDEVCTWTETPYKYAGSTRKGIDCSGFAKHLYRTTYGIELSGGSRHIFNKCQRISQSNLVEGDLVFFKIYNDQISHVGVYLGNGYFAHASTKKGVMVSNLSEAYYKKRFYSGGRIALSTPKVKTVSVDSLNMLLQRSNRKPKALTEDALVRALEEKTKAPSSDSLNGDAIKED